MNVCASAGCYLGIPRVGNESRVARSRNRARFEEVKTWCLTRTDCVCYSFGEAICTFDEFLKFNSCSITYTVNHAAVKYLRQYCAYKRVLLTDMLG